MIQQQGTESRELRVALGAAAAFDRRLRGHSR